MDSVIKGLILSCLIGFLVACSLEPLTDNKKVWIRIDDSGQPSRRSPLGLASASPAPSSLSNFDCLGVNVSGPGILDSSKNPEPDLGTLFDRLLRRESYCSYRGILVGPISSTLSQPQEVALVIPPGQRLIQLIGVKEVNGSNSCQAEFNPAIPQNLDPSGRPLEGDFYEVGRAVADLFQDQAITIFPEWSSLTTAEKAFRQVDCNRMVTNPTPLPSPSVVLRAPTTVSGMGTVSSVAMGNHTCFVASGTGAVSCKGANSTGELGNGSTGVYSPTFVSTGITGATEVGVGLSLSCARIGTTGVQCWGLNSNGQVGDGTLTSRTTPVSVTSLSGVISQLSVGNTHACVVTDVPSPGSVFCWGSNTFGEIGDGTNTNRSFPTLVSGISGTQVSAGISSSCAILSDTSVKCWGSNSSGQLGNGGTTTSNVPVTVTGLTGISQVSVGGNHACAVNGSGTVQCWGDNSSGQLGDGSLTNRFTPVTVSGLSGITSVKAGSAHTCALGSGTIKCWGSNANGQLGDGTSANSSVPVSISGTTGGITSISGAPSGYGTCMVGSTHVDCWGANYNAQIMPF